MKVIIAGSRNITEQKHVVSAMVAFCKANAVEKLSEIVSGGARGVDRLAEVFAASIDRPVKIFPAKWDLYGKKAGYLRNKEMGEYADALVAVWDGKSSGTKMMINIMNELKKPVYIYLVDENASS